MSDLGFSLQGIDDDDLIAEIVGTITPEDTQTYEQNRAEQGEYGKLALEFLFADPPRKVIEVEIGRHSESPFRGRNAQAVAQGFRNAFKKARITEKRAAVKTRTNAEGRVAVYLINVRAARQTNDN